MSDFPEANFWDIETECNRYLMPGSNTRSVICVYQYHCKCVLSVCSLDLCCVFWLFRRCSLFHMDIVSLLISLLFLSFFLSVLFLMDLMSESNKCMYVCMYVCNVVVLVSVTDGPVLLCCKGIRCLGEIRSKSWILGRQTWSMCRCLSDDHCRPRVQVSFILSDNKCCVQSMYMRVTYMFIFLDQELIPYRYSSCRSSSCCCWGNALQKS